MSKTNNDNTLTVLAAQVWQVDDTPADNAFVDETTDANDADAADWVIFTAVEANGDYVAIGSDKAFSRVVFDGAGGTAGTVGVDTTAAGHTLEAGLAPTSAVARTEARGGEQHAELGTSCRRDAVADRPGDLADGRRAALEADSVAQAVSDEDAVHGADESVGSDPVQLRHEPGPGRGGAADDVDATILASKHQPNEVLGGELGELVEGPARAGSRCQFHEE